MIPLRLIIHNFRAIEYADIDLSAVTLAAISGRNGAGKSSAFTLAPRFALFGDVIKGISMDDLVRRGSQEMSVTFIFEHQGSVFRVIRTRSTKGKGKSTLELQQQVNGAWESRSAEKIGDTEAKIRSLLNLDDETFTASSMILQGQANAFTGATAGKRKEILSQILGLNIYPELQELARQQAGLLNVEIEKAKDKLLALDERLAGRTEKEDNLRVLEDQHSVTQNMLVENERVVRETEAQIAVLDIKRSRILQIDRDISAIDTEIATLRAEQTDLTGRLDRASKIIDNEVAILEKSIELDQVKQQLATLEARQPEVERLQRELAATETDLKQLTDEISRLNGQMQAVNQQLAGRDALMRQAEEYEKLVVQLQDFDEKANRWNLLVHELSLLETQLYQETFRLDSEERSLTDKIAALEEQEAHIHDSGCLPTCKFQQAAAAAVAELPELRRRLADLDRSKTAALTLSIAQKQIEQQEIGYDPDAHRACRDRVGELQVAVTALAQLAGKEELLEQLELQRDEKQSRQASAAERRDDLQQQMATLEAELVPLPELKARAGDLQRWARLKDELAAARESAANARERIAAIDLNIAGKQSRRDELVAERAILDLDTMEYDALLKQLLERQNTVQQLRRQLAVLAEQIGGTKAVLAALEADQRERDQLAADLEPKAKRWTRYQTLIKAFGRDGIPALIIENAVPQLERIANEILGQMSKGKHYIRFETQRELKSRDGVAETLDIMIGDWTAERPYETFSGGEQLRIDYAIRFALAELLAQRAGNKVEWLTIDEGLGSQDAEHRALVLEAIKSVAGRFRRVLVITHIEDAQAAFDQVIRFENADGGVEVQVA